MKRAEFLEEMVKRYGLNAPDKTLTLSGLVDVLELCGVLESTLNTYCPGDLDGLCPECGSAVGEECRTSLNGPRLPCPHEGRSQTV